MAIETQQSLSGFIASKPHLSVTERGDARFYARVGQERYRREADDSITRLGTSFHNLVIIGRAAKRAFAAFNRGDRFVAEGEVRDLPSGEIFLARRIGHDTARTVYVVQRPTPARSPRRSSERVPDPRQAKTDDLPKVRR